MNILSIGGSDPSSGAGIQGDIRALLELGAHCTSVITALTSQNTSSYLATHEIKVGAIRTQLDSVIDDFEIDAVKIGMLYSAASMRCVASALKNVDAPIIVDPVMISTTNGTLMRPSAIRTFCSQILPIADVLTPNLDEAQTLSGMRGASASAKSLIVHGAKSVIITGIKCDESVCDFAFTPQKTVIKTRAAKFAPNHGGGCAHSAAVTFAMAKDRSVIRAAKFARKFVETHIIDSARVGRGISITGVGSASHVARLGGAIRSFCAMRHAHTLIPECQSNFVLAPTDSSALSDILGVRGRIVRAGTSLVVAGNITRGGSRHVASALATMRESFPTVASCINIKRTDQTLAAIKQLKLRAVTYARTQEPKSQSGREGTTMVWGVRRAVSGLRDAPDIVHNAGSHGKEPMVLVFGRSPDDVLGKVRKIISAMRRPTPHKL